VPRSRMRGAIPPVSITPSWRGAQLKHRDILHYLFNFKIVGIVKYSSTFGTDFRRSLTEAEEVCFSNGLSCVPGREWYCHDMHLWSCSLSDRPLNVANLSFEKPQTLWRLPKNRELTPMLHSPLHHSVFVYIPTDLIFQQQIPVYHIEYWGNK